MGGKRQPNQSLSNHSIGRFAPASPSRKTGCPDSQPDRGALSSRDDLSPAAWRPFPSSCSKNTVFRLVPPGSASEWSTGNPRTHFSGFSVFSRVFLRTLFGFQMVWLKHGVPFSFPGCLLDCVMSTSRFPPFPPLFPLFTICLFALFAAVANLRTSGSINN